MKRFLVALMLVVGFLSADEFEQQTLIGDELVSGGFGGFGFEGGAFNGSNALFSGGKGAWIINHQFYVGGEGYGMAYPTSSTIGLGYGGLIAGIELLPAEYLMHLSFEGMVGAGGASDSSTSESGSFGIATAGLNLVLNVTDVFHVSAGAKYRYANITGFTNIATDALNGVSYNVSFLFGKF
jgi:hypothetical protein